MYCTTIEGDYFESDENSSPPTKTTAESHTSKVESISISSSYVHSTSPIPTLPINITSTTISILETSSHNTNENSGQNHSIETSTRAEDESSTILHMDFDIQISEDIIDRIETEPSSNSIQITIPDDLKEHSKKYKVMIIVGEKNCSNLEPHEEDINDESKWSVISWNEESKKTCMSLYKTGLEIGADSRNKINIGTETPCKNDDACNGPLKPETIYGIGFRSYGEFRFADSKFLIATTTKRLENNVVKKGELNEGVMIAIIAVLVIFIGVGIYFLLICSLNQNKFSYLV